MRLWSIVRSFSASFFLTEDHSSKRKEYSSVEEWDKSLMQQHTSYIHLKKPIRQRSHSAVAQLQFSISEVLIPSLETLQCTCVQSDLLYDSQLDKVDSFCVISAYCLTESQSFWRNSASYVSVFVKRYDSDSKDEEGLEEGHYSFQVQKKGVSKETWLI